MKVLTVQQPFASLIACGAKPIEYRTWSTPYRGPMAIHSATRVRESAIDEQIPDWAHPHTRGAIVGLVELIDCEPCATHGWHWRLRKPRALREPLPWRGRLWLVELPEDVAARVRARTRTR